MRLKPQQIGTGETIFLTKTQINHLQKAAAAGTGAVLKITETQISKIVQRGGSFLSSLVSLAAPFVKSAAKSALKEGAKAGVSWSAEKLLNKIFGSGHWGAREMELLALAKKLTPAQRKTVEQQLIKEGRVSGGGATQRGGFLGMLASIGVPLAISLVKSLIGKVCRLTPLVLGARFLQSIHHHLHQLEERVCKLIPRGTRITSNAQTPLQLHQPRRILHPKNNTFNTTVVEWYCVRDKRKTPNVQRL